MQQKALLTFGGIALLALAVACGGDKKSANPTSPSTSTSDGSSDTSDSVTLKVNGPTPTDPTGEERLSSMNAVLKFSAATGKYVQGSENYTYRVQLLSASGKTLETQTGTALSYTMKTALDADTMYKWRVRAELDGHVGAWQTESFKSMIKPSGYITANEIYDPLTNGKSVGTVVGDHTWLPGVGLRLDSDTAYVQYKLTSTLTAGEYSALITNLSSPTDQGKVKVMAMREGDGDITTNDRRFTIEKRGDGVVAWRVITSNDQVDTLGGERTKLTWHESLTYFFKATWGGRFNLEIRQGGVSGSTIYNFGKPYAGSYDPNPHMVFVGCPRSGRSGPMTVAGMVIREVWVSANPRPSWAND